MGEQAVQLAKAVNYVTAGKTYSKIVDTQNRDYLSEKIELAVANCFPTKKTYSINAN